MVFKPNKSTPDYLFEKANQCFWRSQTNSNARVELEALGNEFMVKAIDLDIKNFRTLPKAITPPLPPHGDDDYGQAAFDRTPPSLTSWGERATVAPRGWLHVISDVEHQKRRLSKFNIDSFPAEVCEME